MSELAAYIDHTILKPTTTHIDINNICEEAVEYGFAAVCVPPPLVTVSKENIARMQWMRLEKGMAAPDVRLATVIGFPFGYSAAAAKLAETGQALQDGAEELDIVIDLIALKAGNWDYLEREMEPLMEMAHAEDAIVKVIIESGVLTDEEIIRCCELYGGMGVDFVKTSTGYADKGATVEAVKLMRACLPESVRIKASGGIRTAVLAWQLIDAGASRLGTSSGVALVKEGAATGGY